MDNASFDALTRRASLVAIGALGLAGVAALAVPNTAAAKKKSRKKGDVHKLCKTQVDPCITLITSVCGGELSCSLAALKCCPLLGNCDATGHFTCLVEASNVEQLFLT